MNPTDQDARRQLAEAQKALVVMREHGFAANSPDIEDAVRQVLQVAITNRDNAETADRLLAAAHAREAALVEERDEARAETTAAHRDRWHWKIQAGRCINALRQMMNGEPWSDTVGAAYDAMESQGVWLRDQIAQGNDDLARDNERLRGALNNISETCSDEGHREDAALMRDTAREALAAPPPATVEQHQAERELRDAAVELADEVCKTPLPVDELYDDVHAAYKAYRALRKSLTKDAVNDRMGKS